MGGLYVVFGEALKRDAGTRLPKEGGSRGAAIRLSRGAAESHDGQMPTSAAVLDDELDLDAGASAHESLRSSARRGPRPPSPWLEPRLASCGYPPEVDLVGRGAGEERMGPVGIEPRDVGRDLTLELGLSERDEDRPGAFRLHRSDGPLDHGEAAVLADRTRSDEVETEGFFGFLPSPDGFRGTLLVAVARGRLRRGGIGPSGGNP